MPIHRSLIGYDKGETIMIAREIGTFSESTSKISGSGAVPDGPSTKAKLETIREIETKMESRSLAVSL